MKKIRISSTSYLFPSETSWDILKKNLIPLFQKLALYLISKKKKTFDHEIMFFFLPKNILEYHDLNKDNFSKNKIKIKIFLKKFETYLKKYK